MLPRRTRLPREHFNRALSAGRRISLPNLSAVIPTHVRGYAVVVSKKVAKLSVERHRIKRRVAAALSPLTLPPGLIVFPKASVRTMPFSELREELRNLLSKI